MQPNGLERSLGQELPATRRSQSRLTTQAESSDANYGRRAGLISSRSFSRVVGWFKSESKTGRDSFWMEIGVKDFLRRCRGSTTRPSSASAVVLVSEAYL